MSMSILDELLIQAERRARRQPRAKHIAARMLDDPVFLHEVVYRQTRSLWAGHLWALTFWTDVLSRYVDEWHARHDYFGAQGTALFDQVTLAYARSRITPERELPQFMRQRPGCIYLHLPRENLFPRLKRTPLEQIAPNELPWLYFYLAEQSARGYFPPEHAWPLAIAEAGYWTALMFKTRDTDDTARRLGMNGIHYRDVVAKARRLAEERDPANVKRAKDEFLRRHEGHRTRMQPEHSIPEGTPF